MNLEAEQDLDGGGAPLASWSVYWLDVAGDAHPLCESTDKATAKLIAAAPEMLAALRIAEDVLADAMKRGDLGPHETGTLNAIRAAIAKART